VIEYDITQQAANKLAGLCPFCASDKEDLHEVDCPKLLLMSRMSDQVYWDGKWPSWGDGMVRNEMRKKKGYLDLIRNR